jgi:shikimate 5-dehydrogenase
MADVVFVGVTTGSSLAHRAFVNWQPLIGIGCALRGVDIGLHADAAAYVELLESLAHDKSVIGAVVTTHKLRLFEAGKTRFEWLDSRAVACEEVNAVRRLPGGSLHGWARDPVSVGRVVDRIWPEESGAVVCLGAGGTAVALAHHLTTTRPLAPFLCADPDHSATARLARIAQQPVVTNAGNGPWDQMISSAPPSSLVVNATGLGKDRPGCPVTEHLRFPTSSVVWDLNYRGELHFLDIARRQAQEQHLAVHDGWELFCHGWAAALGVILDLPDDSRLGDRFLEAAEPLRPKLS